MMAAARPAPRRQRDPVLTWQLGRRDLSVVKSMSAGRSCVAGAANCLVVMLIDGGFYVGHATVADFNVFLLNIFPKGCAMGSIHPPILKIHALYWSLH